MQARALKLALLLTVALLATVVSPRSAEAGVILTSPAAAPSIDDLAPGAGAPLRPPATPNPDIDKRSTLDGLPASPTGCGAPVSPAPSIAGPSILADSVELPPPPLVAKLLLEVTLLFPNPPPQSLLRPPRCAA
jgi:hypothetical protein